MLGDEMQKYSQRKMLNIVLLLKILHHTFTILYREAFFLLRIYDGSCVF